MATTADPLAALRDAIGVERGPTSWRTVTQEDIDAFARITNDHQWIHVDVERARRESPFGTTIAHGYLTLSLIAPMVAQVGLPPDAKAALNYGLDKVRFIAPVKAGARVRGRLSLSSVQPQAGGRMLL